MENDTFNKRIGTTDLGKHYENVLIANLTLQLVLDKTIDDFKLSANDEKFGDFDDIVVETESNGEKKIYAIQLKHFSNVTKKLSKDSFKKNKEFDLQKYFTSFKNIKQGDRSCNFILFTNEKCDMEVELKIRDNDIIRVKLKKVESKELFTNGLCYKFEIMNSSELPADSKEYHTFFDNLLLYTNQSNAEKTETDVRLQFEQIFSCSSEESAKFLQFISQWHFQDGTKVKLNKPMMRKVIAVAALWGSTKPLAFTHTTDEMKLVRRAIDNFNITAIQEESYDKIKILWSDLKFKVFEQNIEKLARKFPFLCLKESVADTDDNTLSKLLWLLEMTPLIVSENQTVHNVMDLCRKEKFILVSSGTPKEQLSPSRIFQNLSNLDPRSELYQNIVTTFKCLLQGKEIVTLDFLIKKNDEIRTIITPEELVKMLDRPYQIGENKEFISESYINRHLSVNYIDINYLKNVDTDTLIVLDCMNQIENILKKLGNFNLMDIKLFFRDNDNNSRNCGQFLPNHRTLYHTSPFLKNYVSGSDIYISDKCSLDDFQKICDHNPKMKKYHHLKIIDEKTLEWVRSKGDISDLSRYRREERFVEETTFYTSEFDNNVNVVNGDPGTGKSELLKNIKNNCGVDFWCIFLKSVDTTLLCTRLEKIQADERESELIEFIRDTMYVGYPNFDKEVITLLIKNRHVVYFWDALDEVTTKCTEIVIDLIKELSQKSVFQWITSRCHLKKQLEKKFGVLSKSVSQFSEEEQTRYIHQRLKDFYSDEHIDKVIQQIRTTVTSIKNNNILATPLQIYMFTELFHHNPVKYRILLEKLFSLTDLYQHIIDEKFNRYYKEKADVRYPNNALRQVLEGYKKSMFEKYEKAGLKSLVKKEVFKQLNINCDDFLNEIQDRADSIGLITEVTDKFPQFLHNSYAEFFVAKYFIEHHSEINDFEKIIFDSRYTNVRFFYDLLTAKDSIAHKAVLYRNTDLLMKQYMDDMITCEDTRGRNVLQIACSWGQRLPVLQVEKNDGIYVIDNEKDDSLCGEPTEYIEMLQYLLENCHTNGDQELKNAALESAKKSESLLAKLILLGHSSSKLRNDDDGISILYYSAKFGYTQAIDLFDNVPYVKTKKCGFSLLHLSVNYGQGKYVKKLLSIEAYQQNIDDKDENGETPLYKACQYGYYNLVVYLVDHGANVNATTSNGSSPLHTACLHLHTNIVRFLLSSKANINAVKNFNITPLHVACWNGHYDVVDLLLQNGANINSAASDGCTPLYVASRNRHDTVVKLLLQKNVDINLAQENGVTPLFIACQEGHIKNINLLLRADADVNRVTKSGESPLYVASQNGHEAVVKLLIMFGAELNAVADNGFMPIHIASQQGFSKVVQLLLERGVDANICSTDGMTALSMAKNLGHDDVASLLKRSRLWNKAFKVVNYRLNFVKKLRT
ncbi:hypothetical protein Zmor_014582 [Zophobas morio]|uniref:NACHT domain-containing protein n=1 Tax=Zophobas morio TaxID=2755281 RepID=A0AA38IK09_9CUCU|nr:hypothetical protein Zmor_014582 [Zophobas morio]